MFQQVSGVTLVFTRSQDAAAAQGELDSLLDLKRNQAELRIRSANGRKLVRKFSCTSLHEDGEAFPFSAFVVSLDVRARWRVD